MPRDDAAPDVYHLYERYAREYDRDRGRALVERSYLDEMLDHLGERPRILDLGCGSGEPIARFFIEKGGELTGVDAAPAMITLCRQRFPKAHWLVADMRALDLESRFDGILAWDSFFHLGPDDQRRMFEIFAAHIAPRGLLLFTTGPQAGEATGDFYGNTLFHASLDRQEYDSLLDGAGFTVLRHRSEDPDCGLHTVWLAQSVR
jgi:SAM-dependent methyltransferase